MNKWKIATGILVAALTYDTYVGIVNKRRYDENVEQYNELYKKYVDLADKQINAVRLTELYAKLLNDNKVPLDDYTQIIMNHLVKD